LRALCKPFWRQTLAEFAAPSSAEKKVSQNTKTINVLKLNFLGNDVTR
jgi:hypothetical protein